MLKFDFEKNCYGCGICAQVCTVQAIKMIRDPRGFAMPKVDSSKCCRCGQCSRSCIHLNVPTRYTKVQASYYCASLRDREMIATCTSGGVFRALAEECLTQGGFVCGCIWDENFRAVHVLSDDRDTIKRMSGSKYVESDLESVQIRVKTILESGRRILFSGTPCQVASLHALVGDPENLLTMAIICEGVASPRAWEEYKAEMEKGEGARLSDVRMRSKEPYGWDTPTSVYHFSHGGVRKYLSYATDPYVVPMLHGLFMRNSCMQCVYKGNSITADLIAGDYWGASAEQIRQNGNRGMSTVVVRTVKGRYALNDLLKVLELKEISEEEAARNNDSLYKSINENMRSAAFFEHLDEIGYMASLSRAVPKKSWSKRVVDLMFRIGVYGAYRRLKRSYKFSR